MYDAVVTWHHARVGRFLDLLSRLPEPNGSLLDHTLVVYGSSLADGHDHGDEDLPLLVAGGEALGVRTGRSIDPRRPTSLSRLHLEVLQRCGTSHERWKDATSPLNLG